MVAASKVQSYAAMKQHNLSVCDIDAIFEEMKRRGLLREFRSSNTSHIWWMGSVDTSSPAHPRSTSVRVSADGRMSSDPFHILHMIHEQGISAKPTECGHEQLGQQGPSP